MYHKLNPMTALLVIGLLVALVTSSGSSQLGVLAGNNNSPDFVREPQDTTVYMGLFKVDSYYNETKLRDRLKLSKGYLKQVIKIPFGTNQKLVFKATMAEELMRCENLTLAHPEMESLVDCKTLEAQVLAEGLPQPRQTSSIEFKTNYVKKSTIRIKQKPDVIMIQSYPLQSEFTARSIDAILLANGMKSHGFGELATQHGNYFELTLPFGGIRCSGNLFTITNQSEPAPTLPACDGYPQLFDLINHHLWEIFHHGGLMSFQDVSCEKPNQLIAFSLDLDFTLIYRMEFPYVTLRHTMIAQPMSSLWQYEGVIKQRREEPAQSDAYNTTIKVTSQSSIFEYLQFAIDQSFVNTDLKTGFEHMVLNHPLVRTIVRGNWTVDALAKSLEIYLPGSSELGQKLASLVLPDLKVDYKDDANEDHVELGLKMTRDVMKSLSRFPVSIPLESLGSLFKKDPPEVHREETSERKPDYRHTEL